MDNKRISATRVIRFIRSCWNIETLLTGLTLLFIVGFHRIASEDRLVLNLYYIAIAGCAYALVRRRAIALMIFIVAVAIGTTLAEVYFGPKSDPGDRLIAPVLDLLAWCTILLLAWRLIRHAFKIEEEARRMRIQREIDERALAMRAAALTCTSHEVRTPLAGILSFAEMLLDGSSGPLNELQKDFVHEIDRCGNYLLSLVNDIMDYAKVQAGQIKLALETVALPELVEQCVSMVRAKAVKQDIRIAVQLDPSATEITADPIRLKQILVNLLSNAVKYSPGGGLVRIQTRTKDQELLISVRDTGRGMTREQLAHLFDPYFQASIGDQRIGTGLGLGIAKLLVNLHGGDVSVESTPGSGTLFTVRLPGANSLCPETPKENWLSATTTNKAGAADLCETAA